MTSTQENDEADRSGHEREIAEVVSRYEDAFNQNDAGAMNALFTPDTIFVNFGGNLVFGAENLYRAQSFVFAEEGPLADISVSYTIESIVLLTPEVAAAHARQRTVGESAERLAEGSDPMEGVLAMTLMRDAEGRWRIRMAQNTPVLAE
ncbi:conserved hypothetical protein [Streptomyces zhaozhouensis]|uniref:DUF4440 domain-containing protein n=1 Tax=Streptomyces zhaozhouensis TaxID=1300267 RepID=A0A286E099_9ACTN|nr:SgcJ/EcaC family oxidoreductase [Streptomyces zhaozhouensis]SOD64313.1 conserved hypothetical protein [Streptomyces zhaozhouensis]